MYDLLSSIGDKVNTAMVCCAETTCCVATTVYGMARPISNFVGPKLADLVAKVESLELSTYLEGAARVAQSPLGMTVLALGSGYVLMKAAHSVENKIAKGLLLLAGITAFIFSAVMLTRPYTAKA